MTTEEHIKNNELIKLFMSENSMNVQPYHKDWNDLMRVIIKIETTPYPVPERYRKGFLKNALSDDVTIDIMYDSREEFKGWLFHVSYVLGRSIIVYDKRYETKIEAAYQAVISFINWFNNKCNFVELQPRINHE